MIKKFPIEYNPYYLAARVVISYLKWGGLSKYPTLEFKKTADIQSFSLSSKGQWHIPRIGHTKKTEREREGSENVKVSVKNKNIQNFKIKSFFIKIFLAVYVYKTHTPRFDVFKPL